MKFLIVLILLCTAVCNANIADLILKNYKENVHKLPLVKQEHFSVRMYRITGNEKYLNPVIDYVYFLSREYRYLLSSFDHSETILKKTNNLLKINKNPTQKYKLRVKKISQYGDLYFYLHLLEVTNKIFSYHLENTPLFPQTHIAIDVLKNQTDRLEEFILNEENIKLYGAQLINYVYYLHDLDIIYLKESYTKQFQQTFPDYLDSQLSTLEYEAKIYGMTHFITAASHYYQNTVDDKSFHWISEYFEHNIDQIIKRTENDVIAEVGVCLMLLNKQDSTAIEKIKRHLRKTYDFQHQMIPALNNSIDFTLGEHRNILTVMLFKWPEKLTAGPFLHEKNV